jgi:hypothetical protein
MMSTNALNLDEQLVSCEICLKSIPAAESNSVETEEYVAYFCGLECYNIWKQQSKNATANASAEQKSV